MTIRKNIYWFDGDGEPLEEWISLDGCALHDGRVFAQLVRAYQAAYKTSHGIYDDVDNFRLYDLSETPLPEADDVVDLDAENNWIRAETICLYEVWNRLNVLIKSAPYTDDEGDKYLWGEPGTEDGEDGIDPLIYVDGFEDLINPIQAIAWFFGGPPPDSIRYREKWKSYIQTCRDMLDKMKFVYSVDLAGAVTVTITRKIGLEDTPSKSETGDLVTSILDVSLNDYRLNGVTRLYEDIGDPIPISARIVTGMTGQITYNFPGTVGSLEQIETGTVIATAEGTSGASSISNSGASIYVWAVLRKNIDGYEPRPLTTTDKPLLSNTIIFLGAGHGPTIQTLGEVNSYVQLSADVQPRRITSATYSLSPEQAALLSGRSIPVQAYIDDAWTTVDHLSESNLSVDVSADLSATGDEKQYAIPLMVAQYGRWDFDEVLKYTGEQKFLRYSSEEAENDPYASMVFRVDGMIHDGLIDRIVIPSSYTNIRLGAITT